MNIRRSSSLTSPLAAMVILLAACSGTEPTPEADKDPASAEPTTTTTAVDNKMIDDSIVLLQVEISGFIQYPTESGGTEWSERWTKTGSCTAWFAGPEGEIVTAGHCIDTEDARKDIILAFLEDEDASDLASDAISNWKVEGKSAGSPLEVKLTIKQPNIEGQLIQDWTPVQLIDRLATNDGDLALLRANGLNGPTPGLSIATEQPESGDPVTAIGFPGSVSDVSNEMTIQNPSFKTGTVSSRQISEQGVAGLEINAELSEGMSGGPTINSAGEVIGVNSYTINGEDQAFNFVTDTRDLNRFLEQNGVGN